MKPSLRGGLGLVVVIALLSFGNWARSEVRPLRIGLPESAFHTQYGLVADWQRYLQTKLGRPVEFINNNRADSFSQLHTQRVDFAWVTDYPNVTLRRQARLVAVPLHKGSPFIVSYLIISALNGGKDSLMDLGGTVLAYADPNSNSHVEYRYVLRKQGKDPKRFFRKLFFTHDQRESIQAVVIGMSDASEVDSFVWDGMVHDHPELKVQTRIVARSHEFGAPPLVANDFVSQNDLDAVQRVLLGMSSDPAGAKLLKQLNIDGFIRGDDKLYESVLRMRKDLGG